VKADEAKPQASRGGVPTPSWGQRPASTSRSRDLAFRLWPEFRGHAVPVADKLFYDGRRKAAIFVALLDPRDPETVWRRADQSMNTRLKSESALATRVS
jgi:hypothetical protein